MRINNNWKPLSFSCLSCVSATRGSPRIYSASGSRSASPSTSSSPNRPSATISASLCPSWRKWSSTTPWRWAKRGPWFASRTRWQPLMSSRDSPRRPITAAGRRAARHVPNSPTCTGSRCALSSRRRRHSAKTLARPPSARLSPGTLWSIATCSWSSWASASFVSSALNWRRWAAIWRPTSS